MSLIVTFEDLPRYLTISCLTLLLLLSQVFFTRYAYEWFLTFLSLMNTNQAHLVQFCRQQIMESDFCISNDRSNRKMLSANMLNKCHTLIKDNEFAVYEKDYERKQLLVLLLMSLQNF